MKVDEVGEIELTPAASEKLDQNIDLVRRQILREISRQHRGPGHVARVSDVESVVNDISFFGESRRVSSVSWLAVVLACASFVAELISHANEGSGLWLAGGAALLTGAAAAMALVAVTLRARRRTAARSRSHREFLYAFRSLEDDVRYRARELLGPVADSASLGRVISAVELLQLWTPEDSTAFRRLLGMRNSLVHEDGHVLTHRLTAGFAQMTRLSSLLDSQTPLASSNRMRRPLTALAGLAYEERVVNVLRQADLDISSVQKDASYDLVVHAAQSVTRIAIKFRGSGILTVHDVADVVDDSEPNAYTVIVTNTSVSPYVYEYAQLSRNGSGSQGPIRIVTWEDGSDPQELVSAVRNDSAA